MKGKESSKRQWEVTSGHRGVATNCPKKSVSEMLAAEQALTYEERVRKAMNLKPYLDYLSGIFSEKLSDSSSSEDESQIPLEANAYIDVDSKCSTITEDMSTLNFSSREPPILSPSNFCDVKSDQVGCQVFSPANSYSLGLSPDSNEHRNDHVDQDGSDLPPLSELELHKYLEKSAPSPPTDDYLMSFLGTQSSSDFKSKRKRKWDSHIGPSSSSCELKSKSLGPGCSNAIDLNISKAFTSVPGDLNSEDVILPTIEIDGTEVVEGLKIKDDPDKILLADTYGDFRDCMKSSSTHDKLNLNQTAREDNDEECDDDGSDRKRIEGMDDDDVDSLSDYMNITANSALALDTYFKFDAEELSTAADSPISPSVSQIIPTLSIHGPLNPVEIDDSPLEDPGTPLTPDIFVSSNSRGVPLQKHTRLLQVLNMKRRRIYVNLCRKEVIRVARIRSTFHEEIRSQTKQLATMCSRYLYQDPLESQKLIRGYAWRAKRLTREMLGSLNQNENYEKENIRTSARETEDQRQFDFEMNEMRSQQQNFRIMTMKMQMYTKYTSDKLNGDETSEGNIVKELAERIGEDESLDEDIDLESRRCIVKAVVKAIECDRNLDADYAQTTPLDVKCGTTYFNGSLKPFQKVGVDWLVERFGQTVDAILADESGLGKTVQALALLAKLTETRGNWGPFIVITESTEHWCKAISKFLPTYTGTLYAGNYQERLILRSNWQLDTALFGTEMSPFHILITSSQVVAADFKHLDLIRWQYLILDEKQSLVSSKLKTVLKLNCRSRLLLSGRTYRNMKESWHMLHFVMSRLFAMDETIREFDDDLIQCQQDSKWTDSEADLAELHRMLAVFRLRRSKKDVEDELPEKTEALVICPMSLRQRLLTSEIKERIRIEYARRIFSVAQLTRHEITNLMTDVMRLRKIGNHPDLCEKRDIQSPIYMKTKEYSYPRVIDAGEWECSKRLKNLKTEFIIFNPNHIHTSFSRKQRIASAARAEDLAMHEIRGNSEWSFIRFIGIGAKEMFDIVMGGFQSRWTNILCLQKILEGLQRDRFWKKEYNEKDRTPFLKPHDFLLYPDLVTSFPNVENSQFLNELIFVSPTTRIYSFLDQHIYTRRPSFTSPVSRRLLPTFLPSFFTETVSKVVAARRSISWRDVGDSILSSQISGVSYISRQIEGFDLESVRPRNGWSGVISPSKGHLVLDSGKFRILKPILSTLESTRNKIVIYTQMTRMLNILEEFIISHNWNYVRYDTGFDDTNGLQDSHMKSEFLIILIWTRAAIDIDLSFVDTVIFYDSDWNPLVNRQALECVYRLDRTKKLTIYRLVTEGTIEYNILERTANKSPEEDLEPIKPIDLLLLLQEDEGLNFKSSSVAAGTENSLFESTDYRSFGAKRKTDIGLQSRFLKDRFEKKFNNSEFEQGSSATSSVSVSGSSPADSERCPEEAFDSEPVDEESESEEDEAEISNLPDSIQDFDCVDGTISHSNSSTPNILDWNYGSISDYDEDFGSIKSHRPIAIKRGGNRRGRPPNRIRVLSREVDGSRRGRPVGRPRLKRVGPLNQAVRGRKPGRPPLAKKSEAIHSSLTDQSDSISLNNTTIDSS